MSTARKKRHPKSYWTPARIKAVAKKYKWRTEFRTKEQYACKVAEELKIYDDVCSHMEPLPHPKSYWTPEHIKAAAKECKWRTEFYKKHPTAYKVAKELKIYDDVCSHMERLRYPRGYWDDFSRVKEEAEKYKTKTAFHRGSGSAYSAAWRHDWLKEVCSHMDGS